MNCSIGSWSLSRPLNTFLCAWVALDKRECKYPYLRTWMTSCLVVLWVWTLIIISQTIVNRNYLVTVNRVGVVIGDNSGTCWTRLMDILGKRYPEIRK